ncbi:SCAN domain-containing protein 3 [Trichonephila clavata]|uniref:SCAN domain-containing protein 3 n=1 Tax=Trichonephila clavata TaxID=2740835 RepID=A0A8X6K866_TRICU|nr:SCAN domain-containing protein 3 [Trichonephila clavata]
MVLGKDDKDNKAIVLSNKFDNRIDKMSEDIEMQLVKKLKTRTFSVQLDESPLRDSEAVLITYIRYVNKDHFAEEMLFCKSLESTTTSKDIYNKLKTYLDANNM